MKKLISFFLVLFVFSINIFAQTAASENSIIVNSNAEKSLTEEEQKSEEYKRPNWVPKTALQHYFGDEEYVPRQRQKRPPQKKLDKTTSEGFNQKRIGPEWIYKGADDSERITVVGCGKNWEQASLEAFFNLAQITASAFDGEGTDLCLTFGAVKRMSIYYMRETATCYVLLGLGNTDFSIGKNDPENSTGEKRSITVEAKETDSEYTDEKGKPYRSLKKTLKVYYKDMIEVYEYELWTDGKIEKETALIDGEEVKQFVPKFIKRTEDENLKAAVNEK